MKWLKKRRRTNFAKETMCRDKRRCTERQAVLTARYKKKAEKMIAYKCKYCGWWHVGHQYR